MIHIGTAGWAIRGEHKALFPGAGPHLSRIALRLNGVEINSSFYRPHRPATYARWARETPDGFAFSVKMPRAITHEARLKGGPLGEFLDQCGALGAKLGCVLIQLPPSLPFAPGDFFDRLRDLYQGPVAIEPRHKSWFASEAGALLEKHRIARVAADPPVGPFVPGGWGGLEYWRLHGSPKIYYSHYNDAFLRALAGRVGRDAWVIFDNTALGHAMENALAFTALAGHPISADRRRGSKATARATRPRE